MHHGFEKFFNEIVFSFSHTIMLWIMGNNQLPLNLNFLIENNKFCRGVLSSVIGPQNLDLLTCQVFRFSFEFLKLSGDFIHSLHEIDPCLTREVINKCYIV